MLKRIFITITLLLVAAYLVVAITAFNRPPARTCHDVELVLKDTMYAGFFTKAELLSLLEKKGISPVGKSLERIHSTTLEKELNKHPLVERVECYKTPSGKLCMEVSQRIPVLRVLSDDGADYYIDTKGTEMPAGTKCVAHLAVVTGRVEKSSQMRELANFGVFLQSDSFWKAQVEQIHLLPNRTVELVPRVGDHTIYLGKLNDYEKKLERVRHFYKKGLNQVGWNRYSRINVEFGNQIICTKK